jgi:hypothetical protein
MNRESLAVTLAPHLGNPFARYFEKMDFMCHKYTPKIYKLFKNLNIKQFGPASTCYKPHASRGFTTWRKIEIGGYYQGETDALDRPDGMGVIVQPNHAIVIGYHNEETEHGQGIQITNEGNILMGSWHSHTPWDVDIYHDNLQGERMFSQVRNGESVKKENVKGIRLAENPFFLQMTQEACLAPKEFRSKINSYFEKMVK